MKAASIDRQTLVNLIKNAVQNDPSILKEVVEDIKSDTKSTDRLQEVMKQVEADFQRFDEVFKALA